MPDHTLLSQLNVPRTVGELIRLADAVPECEVIDQIPVVYDEVQKLAKGDDRQLYLRHLIVLGTLIKRAVYEVCDVAKDLSELV